MRVQEPIHLDARKSLEKLQSEWLGCTKCELGEQRDKMASHMVFGEGVRGGIMFIAGGPGEVEAEVGRPFVGPSGKHVLRPLLKTYGLDKVAYITNLVVCRSCTQQMDNAGQPVFQQSRDGPPIPLMKDEDPAVPNINACIPRLVEEIYLVDPILIVALGRAAAETLLQRSVTITRERGLTGETVIPSVRSSAVRTETRGVWIRKIVDGKFVMPTTNSGVRYLTLLTLHPAHVARNLADNSPDGPFQSIARDFGLAARVYHRFLDEVGAMPVEEI